MLITAEQERALKDVSDVVGWCTAAFELLPKEEGAQGQRKFVKIASKYYSDILNFSNDQRLVEDIYDEFTAHVAFEFIVDKDDVVKAFDAARNVTHTRLDIECVLDRIPERMTASLVKCAGVEEFVSLTLRYHVPCMAEGLFLSVPERVYKMLIDSSELPFWEAFASPFNHNCKEYCSPFPQDAVYGSMGRFEDYISALNIPTRVCINPPYTPRIIASTIRLTIDYINRMSGNCEVIILMSSMYNFEEWDELRSFGNTCSEMLSEGMYAINSFFSEKHIVPPIDLMLVVNIRNSKARSEKMMREIKELMYSCAMDARGT